MSTRIKAGREHRVPLVPAALALLGEPEALVFASPVRSERMLSAAIEQVAHH